MKSDLAQLYFKSLFGSNDFWHDDYTKVKYLSRIIDNIFNFISKQEVRIDYCQFGGRPLPTLVEFSRSHSMEFTIYADKSGYGIGIEARLRDENNLNKNEISEDGYITLLIYWDGSAELELTNNDSRVNNANGSRVYKVSAAQFLKDI